MINCKILSLPEFDGQKDSAHRFLEAFWGNNLPQAAHCLVEMIQSTWPNGKAIEQTLEAVLFQPIMDQAKRGNWEPLYRFIELIQIYNPMPLPTELRRKESMARATLAGQALGIFPQKIMEIACADLGLAAHLREFWNACRQLVFLDLNEPVVRLTARSPEDSNIAVIKTAFVYIYFASYVHQIARRMTSDMSMLSSFCTTVGIWAGGRVAEALKFRITDTVKLRLLSEGERSRQTIREAAIPYGGVDGYVHALIDSWFTDFECPDKIDRFAATCFPAPLPDGILSLPSLFEGLSETHFQRALSQLETQIETDIQRNIQMGKIATMWGI